ncbi:hypothetical protein DPMN_090527 [Dreissena polymorpha]|uniref:Uncharacterized protein n=1 Tax=Dreissena polymorpha TaxID=45954 RepID=A0A9D4KYD2_DREPO|nr:hypothetical protein DPMN_090527 [Dreissena polymorpha]
MSLEKKVDHRYVLNDSGYYITSSPSQWTIFMSSVTVSTTSQQAPASGPYLCTQ